tara:strand:+ start:37 stop:441 length:405 start_codon:yes stop_codon:yes gene_type:complete
MNTFTAYTLVDITNSGITRPFNNILAYNQQQNLNTLIQTIGIRSQPLSPIVVVESTQDLVKYQFGKQYKGLHTVWKIKFSIEHSDVFRYKGNRLHHLYNDSDGIAIISNLSETANINTGCFETTDQYKINLYFK